MGKANQNDNTRSRRRMKHMRFGDPDFQVNDISNGFESEEATWAEVGTACCCRSPLEWVQVILAMSILVGIFYLLLVSMATTGASAKTFTGCQAGEMFQDSLNPLTLLMAGVVTTAMLHSSSTVTSIIVSLVGSGSFNVQQAIYMVMGANIGTSITNVMVSCVFLSSHDKLYRAFSGAALHDLFNIFTAGVLFPLELTTGYLAKLTQAIAEGAETREGDEHEGFLKSSVDALANLIIISNSKVVKAVAKGGACTDFYPIECEGGVESYETCKVGLIGCNKETGICPIFFNQNATLQRDTVMGAIGFVLSLVAMFTFFYILIQLIQFLLNGTLVRVVHKATNFNGYIGIAFGTAYTMFVESSTITTSTYVPFAGLGAIRLDKIFPLTLGSNIGTTLGTIMAALVTPGLDPLQVALAHLFFNVTGVLIWYPIPYMREFPLGAARFLGRCSLEFRYFPILYIFMVWFVIPISVIFLVALFEGGKVGAGVVCTILLALITVALPVWLSCFGGKKHLRKWTSSCCRGKEEEEEEGSSGDGTIEPQSVEHAEQRSDDDDSEDGEKFRQEDSESGSRGPPRTISNVPRTTATDFDSVADDDDKSEAFHAGWMRRSVTPAMLRDEITDHVDV